MSTLNLGKIRFNWAGAYNNSTAYVANDVVSSGGNSYICKLASTGNAVSNGTYWDLMSQAGTNGTDLTSTLTAQGDIVYRDGSGLQKLAKPASDKFLKNTSGGVVSWDDAGGAWNFIGTAVASNSASLTVTGLDTSIYESFCIRLTNLVSVSDGQPVWVRLGDSSGIDSGGSDYNWVGIMHRAGSTSPGGNGSTSIGQIIIDTSMGTGTGENVSCTMWLSADSATNYPNLTYHSLAYSSVPDSMCNTGGGTRTSAINVTQIQVLANSGNLASGRMTVWGIAHA